MPLTSPTASEAEIAPVKRGRGRPRMDPSQLKPKPQPTGCPRGRPRKEPSQRKPTIKWAPTGRPRGRPRKEHPPHDTPLASTSRPDSESLDD
ncbi:hypothetical protein B0T22DRAFT_182412 [Podospora appendiculata]|uniref:Uncharacterized protein n=1 Tax=Podospora appendiculata TaxID=314037 RepID=A0AAE0XCQ0_9PEZI|nr:hypothetical protein B0T22DRAFT_118526 [Podospora appendiculata]KAK3689932.1 hypothetical protein B0T22DRAFT_182412 [Podospora appendiculata]